MILSFDLSGVKIIRLSEVNKVERLISSVEHTACFFFNWCSLKIHKYGKIFFRGTPVKKNCISTSTACGLFQCDCNIAIMLDIGENKNWKVESEIKRISCKSFLMGVANECRISRYKDI